ncbi:MAG: hypothetical protein ABSE62_12340 [Chthoniobacteraceae bacterium]|jgi:hypothetical protein
MTGQLGMEIDPRKSEPEYQAAAKTGIAAYKSVRDIVQFGSQYRHISPFKSKTPSLNYVSQDRNRALILAYQRPVPIPLLSLASIPTRLTSWLKSTSRPAMTLPASPPPRNQAPPAVTGCPLAFRSFSRANMTALR